MLSQRHGPLILLACTLAVYGCNDTPRADDRPAVGVQGASASSTRAADTLAFHAVGTEPFWSLDIGPSGLRFTTPEDTLGTYFRPVTTGASGDTLHWTGTAERGALDARVWQGACSDGMSDRVWPYHAAVRVDTIAYRGCAEPRRASPG